MISRRTILKASIMSLMFRCGSAVGKVITSSETILRVSFHGPFAFVVYPDHLVAMTPAIKDHIYTTGQKRAHMLGRGEYRLSGGIYRNGHVQIDSAKAIIVSARQFGIGTVDRMKQRYCAFLLPIPEQIRYLNLYDGGN